MAVHHPAYWSYATDCTTSTTNLNSTSSAGTWTDTQWSENKASYIRAAKQAVEKKPMMRVVERLSHTPAGFNTFDVGIYETLLKSLQREFNIWTKGISL